MVFAAARLGSDANKLRGDRVIWRELLKRAELPTDIPLDGLAKRLLEEKGDFCGISKSHGASDEASVRNTARPSGSGCLASGQVREGLSFPSDSTQIKEYSNNACDSVVFTSRPDSLLDLCCNERNTEMQTDQSYSVTIHYNFGRSEWLTSILAFGSLVRCFRLPPDFAEASPDALATIAITESVTDISDAFSYLEDSEGK